MSKYDTICAVSTASGTGAIAVIRLSGTDSHDIARYIFRKNGNTLNVNEIEPYKVYYGEIFDPVPDDKPMVDDALVTFFKAPHSYTGEDSVEISCHGSEFVQYTKGAPEKYSLAFCPPTAIPPPLVSALLAVMLPPVKWTMSRPFPTGMFACHSTRLRTPYVFL